MLAHVAVDVAVITIQEERIALIRRETEPDNGKLSLIGGHMTKEDASLNDTACRILKEKLGITIPSHKIQLQVFLILDHPDRDPDRPGRHISIVYLVQFPSSRILSLLTKTKNYRLYSIENLDLKEMAFDHFEVILQLRTWLNDRQ